MAELTFTTTPPPDAPVTFSIDGEEFTCHPWLPGAAFLRFSRMMMSESMLASGAIEDFFAEAMPAAEHERFRKFIEDPARSVSIGLLGEIFLGLYARYGAGPGEETRPTEPSGPSEPGRPTTPDGSTENSPSPESTPPA